MGISLRQALQRAALYARLTASDVPGISWAKFDFLLAGAGIARIMATGPHHGGQGGRHAIERETKTRLKPKKPNMYNVVILNDDYTPMEFVTQLLENFFNKKRPEAKSITIEVHTKGRAVAGVYTFEVAETKVGEVMGHCRKSQHPLQVIREKSVI